MPAVISRHNRAKWHWLGFDARESPERLTSGWPQERRDQYLYLHDLDQALSVDNMVWPSVFHRLPHLRPPWTGPVYGWWEHLAELEGVVRAAREEIGGCWIVGAALDRYDGTSDEIALLDAHFRGDSLAVEPAPISPPPQIDSLLTKAPEWPFLGFDVADLGGTSGLSNLGFESEQEARTLRRQWGHLLNENHLFSRLDEAHSFKQVAQVRAPEHAPFFVFGLWRVQPAAR